MSNTPRSNQAHDPDADVYYLRPGVGLGGFEITHEQSSVIARLRQPISLAELRAVSPLAPAELERLLKLLHVAGALVVFPAVRGAPSRRVVGTRAESGPVSVAPPPATAPGTPTTQATATQPATGTTLAPREAPRESLIVPRVRTPVAPAPEAPAPSASVANAALAHFRRAQASARQQKWSEALKQAREAVRLDPEARYEALYAWLLHLSGPSNEELAALVEYHLMRALRRDPRCAAAHYYLGMVHKRHGNDAAAEGSFEQAVALDANLLDAARELRLYAARRVRSREPAIRESGPVRKFFENLRPKGRTRGGSTEG